jgi:formate hydrogenlyase subunit 3/multisubunit Na+/H+ antiporter MnhD subunit
MLEVLTALIFILPLVPIWVLFTATSDARRRSWLLYFIFTLFMVALNFSLLVYARRTLDAVSFGGMSVPLLPFYSLQNFAMYFLAVGGAGYLANHFSRKRSRRSSRFQ